MTTLLWHKSTKTMGSHLMRKGTARTKRARREVQAHVDRMDRVVLMDPRVGVAAEDQLVSVVSRDLKETKVHLVNRERPGGLGFKVSQVHQDKKVHLGKQVLMDRPDHKESGANMDCLVRLVNLVNLASLVHKARRAHLESQASVASKVPLANAAHVEVVDLMVLMVSVVSLDLVVSMVMQGKVECRVTWVSQVNQVNVVHMAQQGHLGRWASLASQATMGSQASQEKTVCLDKMAYVDHKASKALKGMMASLVHLGLQERLGRPARMGSMVFLERGEPLELQEVLEEMASMEFRACLVCWARVGNQVTTGNQVWMGKLEHQDLLAS